MSGPNEPKIKNKNHRLDLDHDDDHHSEHVDEGWLVSYADMMTLLFGLFVLLYSMSKLDQNEAQKIIESTQEKFGKQELSQAKEVLPNIEDLQKQLEQIKLEKEQISENLTEQKKRLEELEPLKIKNEELTEDLKDLQSQLQKKDKENSKMIAELDKSKKEKKSDPQDLKKELSKKEKELASLKEDLEAQKKQNLKIKETEKDFKNQLAQLTKNNKNSKELVKELAQNQLKTQKLRDESEALKEELLTLKEQNQELTKLQKQVRNQERKLASVDDQKIKIDELTNLLKEETKVAQTLKKSMDDLKKTNQDLESKIKAAQGDASSKSFLAFFINWPTEEHDIDLVIKDPTGKKFDFKKRKHGDHPGLFALDTRRGPGAELWQSDRIIPGVYTATYSFYNQYGNSKPAQVLGSIYSPKGSVEISPIEMKIDSKRHYEVQFKVSAEGDIKIIKSQ